MISVITISGHPQTGHESKGETADPVKKCPSVPSPAEKSIVEKTLFGRVKAACKSGSEVIYQNRYLIAGGCALFLMGIILGRTILSSPQPPSIPESITPPSVPAPDILPTAPEPAVLPDGPEPVILPNGDWNPTPLKFEIGGSGEPVPAATPPMPNDTTLSGSITGLTDKCDNVLVSIQTIKDVNTTVKKIEKRLKDIGNHMNILSSWMKGELKLPKNDDSFKLNPVL